MTTYPLSELLTSSYRELKALGASLGGDDALANTLSALEQPAIPGAAATLEVPFEPVADTFGEHDESQAIVSDKLRKLQAVVVVLAEAKRPDLAEQVIADIELLRGAVAPSATKV